MILRWICSLAIGLGVSNALAGDEPFDFRGIRLGITANEFRKIPYPDSASMDHGFPVCTGDMNDKKGIHEIEIYSPEEAGIIKCAFYGKALSLKDWVDKKGLSMGGGGYASYRYDFEFARIGNDPDYRLFSMVLPTNINAMDEIVEALTDKFGVPTSKDEGSVQNRFGASFPQVVITWKNAVSEIVVEGPSGEVSKMAVFYTYFPIAASVEKLRREARKSQKNRM